MNAETKAAYAGLAVNALAAEIILGALKDLGRDETALQWFNERGESVCGYGWCLTVCGLSPTFVRSEIIKRTNHAKS